MAEPTLAHLAQPGAVIELKVRPAGRKNAITETETGLKAEVTVAPEAGKANEAVRRLLAQALGVAPTRLTLVRGAGGRNKAFRLD